MRMISWRVCRTESQAREALRRIGLAMNRLGLKLHPEKTRMVDLRRGKESFVFLGCTIRKKRSIQRNPRAHFVRRWPSPKATKRIREHLRELTEARHSGKDVKQIIATWNPVLRGRGNYFRTRDADREFNRLDSYVVHAADALDGSARRAANGSGGEVVSRQVCRDGLVSTARNCEVPGASHISKIIVKPCAGKLHARFERGS